jgi:UDPglucose 6-dehydrogenase
MDQCHGAGECMNIGIIGVGKLGLAYALTFEQAGLNVFASSYKQEYIKDLQAKRITSTEPGINELLAKSCNIEFTIDNHRIIDQCDFIYVMVATPSTTHGDYDVSAVEQVVDDFISYPSTVDGKILVIGSTVNPGTCDRLQEKLLSRGVHLVYSPTFVAQGTVLRDIPKERVSVGTDNQEVFQACQDVFSKIIDHDAVIYKLSRKAGEILKLAGNCCSTLQITYQNMIGQILINSGLEDELDIASKYLNALKQQHQWKFGFGYGGPCYPRDNRSFVHYSKILGMDYNLGTLVDDFNQSHVEFLVCHLLDKNVNKLPFYFEYISYKKGVSMFEESHQLKVCEKLLQAGSTVYIESTEFLSESIKQQLSTVYSCVNFVKLEDIQQQGIDVYCVNF